MRIYRSRTGHSHTIEVKDQKTTQKYTQSWTVELEDSDPPLLTDAEVAMLPGIPRAGRSTYRPRNGLVVPFAICQSVAPKPINGSLRLWNVVCQFELSGADQEEPRPEDTSPLDLRPRVEPFVESMEQVAYKDFDGNQIVDPFKQLWSEPVKLAIPLAGVRLTRFVPSYDESTLANWIKTTNSAPWRGQPEDAWLIRNVTGKEVEVGNFVLGQLQFEMLSNPIELNVQMGTAAPRVRRVGWLDVRAGRSVRYKNAQDKIEINRDPRGGPPVPTWVDKDGKKSSTPYFFAYRRHRQANFSQIA